MAKKKSWDFYLFFDTHGSMYFFGQNLSNSHGNSKLGRTLEIKKERKKSSNWSILFHSIHEYVIQYDIFCLLLKLLDPNDIKNRLKKIIRHNQT